MTSNLNFYFSFTLILQIHFFVLDEAVSWDSLMYTHEYIKLTMLVLTVCHAFSNCIDCHNSHLGFVNSMEITPHVQNFMEKLTECNYHD